MTRSGALGDAVTSSCRLKVKFGAGARPFSRRPEDTAHQQATARCDTQGAQEGSADRFEAAPVPMGLPGKREHFEGALGAFGHLQLVFRRRNGDFPASVPVKKAQRLPDFAPVAFGAGESADFSRLSCSEAAA
jgi:hypothetical protein